MDFSKTTHPGAQVRAVSSLESVERIKEVARDIALTREQGFRLVVVVSAMGSTTNELAAMGRHRGRAPPPAGKWTCCSRWASGITMSLLSMALAAQGCPAISYTGSQCAIITDDSHTDARILEVKADRVRESLARGPGGGGGRLPGHEPGQGDHPPWGAAAVTPRPWPWPPPWVPVAARS